MGDTTDRRLDDRGGVHRQNGCSSIAWMQERGGSAALYVALGYSASPKAADPAGLGAIRTQEGLSLIERIGEGDTGVFRQEADDPFAVSAARAFPPGGAVQLRYAQLRIEVPAAADADGFRDAYARTASALEGCFRAAPHTRGAFKGALTQYLEASTARGQGSGAPLREFIEYGMRHWETLASADPAALTLPRH